MKRIDNFLNPNETISNKIKPDFIKLFISSNLTLSSIFLLLLVLIAIFTLNFNVLFILIPLVLVLISGIPAFFKHYLTTYYITSEKIIIETGFIGRDYDIVKLDRILDLNLDVTILDSILGTGCVKLCTANESEPIKIANIRNPKKIIRIIKF